MIYTSQDTQNAINRDKNFEEKLDFLLSKHIGSMNSNEFAMICNSIAFDDRKGELAEGSINFITFLTEGINQV